MEKLSFRSSRRIRGINSTKIEYNAPKHHPFGQWSAPDIVERTVKPEYVGEVALFTIKTPVMNNEMGIQYVVMKRTLHDIGCDLELGISNKRSRRIVIADNKNFDTILWRWWRVDSVDAIKA